MAGSAQKIRIGRDAGCDLVLADRSVSRRHADLMISSSGELEVLDMDSSGGTFLLRDGKEVSISRARLKPTDKVRFGEYEISVKELLARIEKLAPHEAPVKKNAPPPLPPLPQKTNSASSGSGGRMVRCECGTIKKKGAACPSCGI